MHEAVELLNWDFENGDDGNWTVTGTGSIFYNPGVAYQGDWFLDVHAQKSFFGPINERTIAEYLTLDLAGVIGHRFWVEFRWNAIAASGGECELSVKFDPGDGVYQSLAVMDYSDWTPSSYNFFKSPEIEIVGAVGRLRLDVNFRTTDGFERFYIDNVEPWAIDRRVLAVPTGPLDKVTICNVALSLIGVKKRITSMTESTVEAESCDLHFDMTLRNALSRIDWAFARKREALVTLAGTPPAEWRYQYALPSDVVRPIRIVDPQEAASYYEHLFLVQNVDGDYVIPFTIETIGGIKVLYTDMENACLAFIYLNEDTSIYPQTFSEYLAHAIAAGISMPLTADRGLRTSMRLEADRTLQEAIADNFNSEDEKPYAVSEHERSRW